MNQRVPKMLVLASTFPAVSETFVTDHVLGLARNGWDVTVAAWHVDDVALAALRSKRGYDVRVRAIERPVIESRVRRIRLALQCLLPVYAKGAFSGWLRGLMLEAGVFTDLARQVRPDVIHAHFGPNGIIASHAARQMGIPLLVNFHGYDVTVVPRKRGWEFYRHFFAQAHAIVHSSFVQDRVQTHIGMPIVHRVALGVDTAVFSAPARAGKWPETLRFLFVGRLIYQKGAHVAIAMLAIFRRHFPDIPPLLTICGDGPQRGFLQQCAREYGVEDCVSFAGAIPYTNVSEEMEKADILLIPSVPIANGWEEAFCRVAIEGMAMGLSVIGSETGGLQETIGSGGNTCRPGSAMALFHEVERLLVSSNPKKEAKRAVERAREFTIERMNEEYVSVSNQAKTV